MLEGGKQISRIVAPEGMKAYFQSGTARGDLAQRMENQNYAIGKQQGDLAKALGATLLEFATRSNPWWWHWVADSKLTPCMALRRNTEKEGIGILAFLNSKYSAPP